VEPGGSSPLRGGPLSTVHENNGSSCWHAAALHPSEADCGPVPHDNVTDLVELGSHYPFGKS
jgi:hypothetical protein